VNPLALALLYPGLGGAPLAPAVLRSEPLVDLGLQAGWTPRLSAQAGLVRPGRHVGWDLYLRGGPTFVRLDPALWVHGTTGGWGYGARIGATGALSRWLDPWFGGTAHVQLGHPLSDRVDWSATAGVEVVSGIYVETSFGPHPYPVADLRFDVALDPRWQVWVGGGWPNLAAAGATATW
jgi:hypothetical protein